MNGQIVLCKGVNDGEELEYSIQKMSEYAPVLQSVSVVPVGLTKFRKGLYPLEPFTKEDAKAVLEQIHRWQKIMYERYGIHFIHASDEWYILAGEELPEEDRYDGYLQLETVWACCGFWVQRFGRQLWKEMEMTGNFRSPLRQEDLQLLI